MGLTAGVAESDRYTRRNILRAEQMYGRGYQSPGQAEAVEKAAAKLGLRRGQRVLDVGSGLGGPAMHLASRYGVEVLGVDTAAAMVELSEERRQESGLVGVSFRPGDVRELGLPHGSFDVVWTRDTILYVEDKGAVWHEVFRLLRPGGQLYVADFCLGPEAASAELGEYLRNAGYWLLTLGEYEAALARAGFADVRAWDETDAFERSLAEELARLEAKRESFLAEFSAEDYRYLVERWRKKIEFCRSGELAWGMFLARRRS